MLRNIISDCERIDTFNETLIDTFNKKNGYLIGTIFSVYFKDV